MDPLTLAAGGAGLSALGGAVKGSKGTPSQVTTHQTQNSVAPAGAQEQALQSQGLQNSIQAGQLATGLEGQIGNAQNFQNQAQAGASNVLNGSAFNMTPEEQQRVQTLRDSLYNQGTQDVNYQAQQGLNGVVNSAGGRGLRGQALGALQGQVLDSANRNITSVANNANTIQAQQSLQVPQQRVQAQQSTINQGLSFADQLRQQALNNRQNLSNPAMLQYMQRERQLNGSSTDVGTSPGQQGGFWNGVAGGIAGGTAGLGTAGNLLRGIGSYNNWSDNQD